MPAFEILFFSIFFWSFCLQSFLNSLFPVLLVTYSFVSAFSFCSSLDIFRPYICHCFILWLYTDLSLTMLLDCYDLHCLPLSLHWKEQLKPLCVSLIFPIFYNSSISIGLDSKTWIVKFNASTTACVKVHQPMYPDVKY